MPTRVIRPVLVSRTGKVRVRATLRGYAAIAKRRGLKQLKMMKRLLNREEEVKHVGQNVVNAAFNQTISSAGEAYRILPDVSEGTDGHQRIGNKIRGKYLIVKGHLQYDRSITDDYMPPNTVRLLILTQRDLKVSSNVSTNFDYANLLKDNVGTDNPRPYGGGMFDNLAPINKDKFTVLFDKKVKMKEHIVAGLGTTGITSVQGTQATYSFVKRIRVPKTLHFDKLNGDTANNFAPFFVLGGVSDTNDGAISVNTPYRATLLSELYFTDA